MQQFSEDMLYVSEIVQYQLISEFVDGLVRSRPGISSRRCSHFQSLGRGRTPARSCCDLQDRGCVFPWTALHALQSGGDTRLCGELPKRWVAALPASRG